MKYHAQSIINLLNKLVLSGIRVVVEVAAPPYPVLGVVSYIRVVVEVAAPPYPVLVLYTEPDFLFTDAIILYYHT